MLLNQCVNDLFQHVELSLFWNSCVNKWIYNICIYIYYIHACIMTMIMMRIKHDDDDRWWWHMMTHWWHMITIGQLFTNPFSTNHIFPPFRTKDEDSEVERGGESVMATGCVSEIWWFPLGFEVKLVKNYVSCHQPGLDGVWHLIQWFLPFRCFWL